MKKIKYLYLFLFVLVALFPSYNLIFSQQTKPSKKDMGDALISYLKEGYSLKIHYTFYSESKDCDRELTLEPGEVKYLDYQMTDTYFYVKIKGLEHNGAVWEYYFNMSALRHIVIYHSSKLIEVDFH